VVSFIGETPVLGLCLAIQTYSGCLLFATPDFAKALGKKNPDGLNISFSCILVTVMRTGYGVLPGGSGTLE
jgi:hypothetical protein